MLEINRIYNLDCFAGRGGTAIAAKKLNRNFVCSEIDKKYADIAQKGLENAN